MLSLLLSLLVTTSIPVSVVDDGGRPMVGIDVDWWAVEIGEYDPSGPLVMGSPNRSRTDGRGKTEIPTVEGRAYFLRVLVAGWAPTDWPTLAYGGTPARVVLTRGVPVSGTVLDAVDGLRLHPGTAEVISSLAPFSPAFRVAVDECGDYTIPALEPGAYDLLLSSPGHEPARRTIAVGTMPVRVSATELWPVTPTRVQVSSLDANPLAGALVVIDDGTPDGAYCYGTTDARGQLDLDFFRGTPFVTVRHPDHLPLARSPARPFTDSAGGLLLRLSLASGADLSGTVVDVDDRPIASAIVAIPELGRLGITDGEGRFNVAGIRPGTYLVRASSRGYIPSYANDLEVPAEGIANLRVSLETGRRLAGVVRDDTSRPVADARVVALFTGEDIDPEQLDGPEPSEAGRFQSAVYPEGSQSSTTDGDGRFALGGLGPGTLELQATADGWAVVTRRVPSDEPFVELTLRRGATVSGTIIDDVSEHPLAGASVGLVPLSADGGMAADGEPVSGNAGPDGRFTLTGLAAGRYLVAAGAMHHSNSLETEIVLAEAERRDGVVLRLRTGAAIAGIVVNHDNDPIAGALVGCAGCTSFFPQTAEATGPDGRFRLSGLNDTPGGGITLDIRHPDYAARMVPAIPMDALDLRIELARGGTIEGDVTDHGKPVVGASVSSSEAHQKTDASGRFRLTGLAPGVVNVVAEAVVGDSFVRMPVEVILPEGQLVPIRIELAGRTRLVGRVVRAGVPVTHGSISVMGSAPVPLSADGSFRIDVTAGPTMVQYGDVASSFSRLVMVPPEPEFHMVLDLPTATVSGRIVDGATGDAIANAIVNLAGDGFGRQARSDAAGLFQLVDIPSGEHRIAAMMDGYLPAEAPVTVSAGATVTGVELALATESQTTSITGTVRTADGAAAFPAMVALIGPMWANHTAFTDGGGRFSLADVAPGTYDAIGIAAGWSPAIRRSLVIAPGGASIDLRLEAEAFLRVTLRRAGRPASGAQIELVPAAPISPRLLFGVQTFATTDGLGQALFRGLPPGSYLVRVTTGSFQREAGAEVVAGRTTELTLDL